MQAVTGASLRIVCFRLLVWSGRPQCLQRAGVGWELSVRDCKVMSVVRSVGEVDKGSRCCMSLVLTWTCDCC
jgi:hypothetical protein